MDLSRISGLDNIEFAKKTLANSKDENGQIQTYMAYKALYIINAEMRAHGVEYLRSIKDTSTASKGVYYINLGGTYDITLCFDCAKCKYFVSSWGDIVEENPSRFS